MMMLGVNGAIEINVFLSSTLVSIRESTLILDVNTPLMFGFTT